MLPPNPHKSNENLLKYFFLNQENTASQKRKYVSRPGLQHTSHSDNKKTIGCSLDETAIIEILICFISSRYIMMYDYALVLAKDE